MAYLVNPGVNKGQLGVNYGHTRVPTGLIPDPRVNLPVPLVWHSWPLWVETGSPQACPRASRAGVLLAFPDSNGFWSGLCPRVISSQEITAIRMVPLIVNSSLSATFGKRRSIPAVRIKKCVFDDFY